MGTSNIIPSRFKRFSPAALFFMGVFPILLSLLIHIGMLIYAHYIRWKWVAPEGTENPSVQTEVYKEGQADDKLQFQGTDKLDSFKSDYQLEDPVQDLSPSESLPEIDTLPDAKPLQSQDILAVDAAAMDSRWVGMASSGQPLNTGKDMMSGSFSRHIRSLREGGLDVVFVFDSTESMVDYIQRVKEKITTLAEAFRNLVPGCRIGLVTYRDRQNDYVTKSAPLTHGINSLKTFLAGITVVGGGDRREAVADGIKVAIQEMAWRKRAKKFILVIGDAPPHKEDMDSILGLVQKFKKSQNGQLSALDIRPPGNMSMDYYKSLIAANVALDTHVESYEFYTDNEKVMEDFAALSEAGGGESARLHDEKRVIRNMLLLIFGTRWELYLDEFTTNL